MGTLTRAQFLREGGVVAAALGFGPVARAESAAPLQATARGAVHADQVVLDARVYTVDDRQPRAEAFAVKHGRFLAVGGSDDIRNLIGPGTEVIDAAGMVATPGFIDCHSHPATGGVRELTEVNLDLRSIPQILDALRQRVQSTPPGDWVVGFKYDDTKVREGRAITRRDLDGVAPDHPVRVTHRGGHISWYNSRAFERAGVTPQTPDPEGGRFERDGGELTGLVASRANDAFAGLIPSGSTRAQRQAGVKLISEQMTATGLTSVHDAGTATDSMIAYQDACQAGEMRFRMYMLARGSIVDGLKAAGVRTGFGDEWLRLGGVKFAVDGSASGRTMAMSTSYVGRPDDFGILTMTQEEVHDAVDDAYQHGFQIGIHANGDVAIDRVLNAYERALRRWPRQDTRLRIEHCTLLTPELLRRIKAIEAIPAPFYTYVYYHGDKWAEYGEEKTRWMFPHRSFLDHGIRVAPASDYVPGPYEPMMAIQSMVTRRDYAGRTWGANQRISVDEALRICTINGAYASFEDDIKGSMTPGKLADYVILAEDPHDTDPDRIVDIPVVRTVVGGRTMHLA